MGSLLVVWCFFVARRRGRVHLGSADGVRRWALELFWSGRHQDLLGGLILADAAFVLHRGSGGGVGDSCPRRRLLPNCPLPPSSPTSACVGREMAAIIVHPSASTRSARALAAASSCYGVSDSGVRCSSVSPALVGALVCCLWIPPRPLYPKSQFRILSFTWRGQVSHHFPWICHSGSFRRRRRRRHRRRRRMQPMVHRIKRFGHRPASRHTGDFSPPKYSSAKFCDLSTGDTTAVSVAWSPWRHFYSPYLRDQTSNLKYKFILLPHIVGESLLAKLFLPIIERVDRVLPHHVWMLY